MNCQGPSDADSPYLAKVLAAPGSPGLAAGSYKAYENAHRQRLVAIFAPNSSSPGRHARARPRVCIRRGGSLIVKVT